MKYHLAETESKFADIIWENEPIASPALVKLCEEKLSWKKIYYLHSTEKALRERTFSE